MSSNLMVPDRCIWCLRTIADVTFDESHVLPECVGNHGQQTLPPGIVCKPCNQDFGRKVERWLLDYPLFHVVAAFLRVADTDGNAFRDLIFDASHPPLEPVTRGLDLKVNFHNEQGTRLIMDVRHRVEGRMVRNLGPRDFAFFSRAIHKIAFEALAWKVYVQHVPDPVDLFQGVFDPVRRWARYGEPMSSVRPMLWRRPNQLVHEWAFQPWMHEGNVGAVVDLFGDWYAMSLTLPPGDVLPHLRRWLGAPPKDTCAIAEDIQLLAPIAAAPTWFAKLSPRPWFLRARRRPPRQ